MIKKKFKQDEMIKQLLSQDQDINKRIISWEGGEITILFIKQLTDRLMLTDTIIKPIMQYTSNNKSAISAQTAMDQIIYSDNCSLSNDTTKIIEELLNGKTIILFSGQEDYLVLNIRKIEERSIEEPSLTFTLRGPKDCFTENLDTNLSLVRYRIKDPQLKIDILETGKRTKARVAVLHIQDIANDNIVNEVLKRINKVNTDGIIDSGELQELLLNNKYNLFPQMGLAERSDMACGALLEGKVVVIVEGSGLALIAPKVFNEFLWSCEDNYDNKYLTFFYKIIRITAVIFSISLTSLFVAVTSFHFDLLPPDYAVVLGATRSEVPFNAVTGALLLEVIVEILRESLLRIPKQIGPAIGIVGTIIIGQAAISSRVFSPLLLILVALSFLSSFAVPDYTIMSPLRILKFVMIILTGIFGLFGYAVGMCFILVNIISVNSYGVPYLAPFAPFNWYDFFRTFFYSKTIATKRPNFLGNKDKIRGPGR